jgi:tetratricopeptide (TPR) repeat protein
MNEHDPADDQDNSTQPYLPPVPPAPVSSSQLPPDVDPFIGREPDLVALRQKAVQNTSRSNRARVILISGKAGVGKSTLALHFAHEIKKAYDYAQLYADFRVSQAKATPYNQTDEERAADILEDFLRALGIQGEALPTTLDERASLFRSLLVKRRALILLDGAETDTQVAPLIPASPTTLVIVTSRSSIHLLSAGRQHLDVMDMASALELLAVWAGEDKIDREPRAAEEVARRCGQLPLAIKIAGARLASRASWSVKSLAEKLGSGSSNILDELREGKTEVAASFSLSYEALTADEQKLFRRLAVFTGPHFEDSAAAGLMKGHVGSVTTILEHLADLNLLEQAKWDDCYRFHNLLLDFARAHFEADESEEVQRQCYEAILEYYGNRLRRADRSLHPMNEQLATAGPQEPTEDERAESLRWLTRERENLVAMVARAIAEGNLDFAWRLAAQLANFFEVRAHHEDWLETHQSVLHKLEDQQHTLGKAVLTRSLGKLFYFQHNWEFAVKNYRDALQLFQQLDDDHDVGITLLYLGDAYRYQREWDSARNTLTAALHLLEEVDFRRGQAITLRSLGAVSRLVGDFDEAIKLYRKALSILSDIGDHRWIAATRLSLSDIYIEQNKPEEARPILEECLVTFYDYGDRHWQALTLRSLGDVFRQKGNFAEALEFLERSLVILREDGDRHWEAAVIEGIGEVHAARGEWQKAVSCYMSCIKMITEGVQDRLLEAHTRKNLGISLDALGDRKGAKDQWRKAWLPFVEQNGREFIEVHKLLREGA